LGVLQRKKDENHLTRITQFRDIKTFSNGFSRKQQCRKQQLANFFHILYPNGQSLALYIQTKPKQILKSYSKPRQKKQNNQVASPKMLSL
jgi:hypothetical protein